MQTANQGIQAKLFVRTENAREPDRLLESLQADANGFPRFPTFFFGREHQDETSSDPARTPLARQHRQNVEDPVPAERQHFLGEIHPWNYLSKG